MNKDLLDFLKRNNIDIIPFREQYDLTITKKEDYDHAIFSNAIFKERQTTNVPISSIIGCSKFHLTKGNDLLSFFCTIFNSIGNPYTIRALDMLKFTPEDIMKRLKISFKSEPLDTNKIKDKYFININGLHRWTLLKLMYLIEQSQGKTTTELDAKYTIPIQTRELDIIKTCCQIILCTIDESISISNEFDSNYHQTNRAIVFNQNERKVMDDNELLEFTSTKIIDCKHYVEMNFNYKYDTFISTISSYIHNLDGSIDQEGTLYKFISEYFPNLINDICYPKKEGDYYGLQ